MICWQLSSSLICLPESSINWLSLKAYRLSKTEKSCAAFGKRFRFLSLASENSEAQWFNWFRFVDNTLTKPWPSSLVQVTSSSDAFCNAFCRCIPAALGMDGLAKAFCRHLNAWQSGYVVLLWHLISLLDDDTKHIKAPACWLETTFTV